MVKPIWAGSRAAFTIMKDAPHPRTSSPPIALNPTTAHSICTGRSKAGTEQYKRRVEGNSHYQIPRTLGAASMASIQRDLTALTQPTRLFSMQVTLDLPERLAKQLECERE